MLITGEVIGDHESVEDYTVRVLVLWGIGHPKCSASICTSFLLLFLCALLPSRLYCMKHFYCKPHYLLIFGIKIRGIASVIIRVF